MNQPATPALRQHRPLVFAIALVWLILSLAGMWALVRYAGTPGYAGKTPVRWPSGTTIERNEHGATLVMFVHPHCPCTRASLGELERIVAQCPGTVKPWVVFLKPTETEEGWERTDLWRPATAIPGSSVIRDPDGEEARRFQAATSGHTLLYDAAGNLLFSGGITASRGHHGDNAGQSAIVTLLNRGSADCRETPVFGCPIVAAPTPQGESP